MRGEKAMYERMRAGERYIADDPRIQAELKAGQQLAHRINTTDPTDRETLRELFTELLAEYGEDAEIRPPFHCDYGRFFSFGARSFANFGLVVLDVADVVVGADAQIGPHVQLLTATHPLAPRRGGTSGSRPSRSPSGTTSGWAVASSCARA